MNPGERIAGRYRVEGRLGVGGMSTVMLAVDERLERYVAVKLLAEHLADDPTFVSRFRREALSAARLVHPNIVQVFDFGFDPESHQHFIVMEHVPGQSCAELLRDRGHLDVEQAVDIVAQACRGLDYAHRNGVVHRDVKPGNLLVSESGVVKLADFGIARATGHSSITQIGSVLGTAAYLSPEQTRGEEAGPYADLYSLGVVAYQLMSGRLPYEATSLSELALKQQREAPIPLRQLSPRVPAELSEAISLAISVIPDERPADAAELSEMLVNGARGISPYDDVSPTRQFGGSMASTRVIPSVDQPTSETMIAAATGVTAAATPRAQRAVPPRQPQRAAASRPQTVDQRQHQAARRFAVLLGIVAVILIAAIIVVLVSGNSGTTVRYHRIVASDAQSAISQLKSIIVQYTAK
jgi:eukaryotic-like serine/threonine-protein kinase